MPLTLTRVPALAWYVRALRKVGAPVEAGLQRARLPTLFEEQPDAWLHYGQVRRFVADMADREGLTDLELAWPDVRSGLHRSIRHPVLEAPTMHQALLRLHGVVRRQNTGLKVGLERVGDQARLCVSTPLPPPFPGHGISEIRTLKLAVRIVETFAGPAFKPTRVRLASPRRDLRIDPAQAFGGVPVETDAGSGAFEFPSELLWLERTARGGFPPRSDEAGEDWDPPSSEAATLGACLEPYLPSGYPPIGLAAEISGCSVRALQRKLANEGTTYSEVVDGARCRTALAALRDDDSDISLAQISLRLGYSEHSAFTRAFRRWTGTTPDAYRAATAHSSIDR